MRRDGLGRHRAVLFSGQQGQCQTGQGRNHAIGHGPGYGFGQDNIVGVGGHVAQTGVGTGQLQFGDDSEETVPFAPDRNKGTGLNVFDKGVPRGVQANFHAVGQRTSYYNAERCVVPWEFVAIVPVDR